MKQCNTCGKVKPLNCFSGHKTSKDGKRGYCGSCGAIKMANYRSTGKTYTSGLAGKTVKSLISMRKRIDAELEKRGVNVS